ncbi:MAG: DUF1015 domain-containing protein [Magnetococcales bacterium]|nr:DUF1015 domain-containing protein [Magnetococcales bacterium]
MSDKRPALIFPFAGIRPRADLAAQVSALPYDVMNTEEAREMAAGNAHSFLHVSKAQIDLDPGIDEFDPAVYEQAATTYDTMVRDGTLQQDSAPSLYVYRLVMDGREQVGVTAAVSVDAYMEDRVKKHEFTRPQKEKDRTDFARRLSAHSGPVFLTYRYSKAVDSIVHDVMQERPENAFKADDGVHHTLWRVADPQRIDALVTAFEEVGTLYVADGHHRSAAAENICLERRKQGDSEQESTQFRRFLAVCFPDSHLKILDYNRVVTDLNGLTEEAFLKALEGAFEVHAVDTPFSPRRPRCFGMYLTGRWYRLTLKEGVGEQENPVASLDVSLLSDHLLSPILGITDPRRDARIDFVGGIRGMEGLMARVDSGEMSVAFSLHPTTLEALMRVADAGEVMPPKSTWFEPKLRDGLVIQGF